MALKKEYKNNQGVTVDYWSITNISKNIRHKTVEVTIQGYLSSDAKNSNYEAIETRKIKILWDDFDSYFSTEVLNGNGNNDIAMAYKYIKKNIELFQTSTDV